MAPSKSEARSATSASRPAARVAKPAARAVVCLGGLVALIASILVLVASPASAVPTAGSRNAATKEVTIKVAPPSSDNAPALQFSFATNNSARCPKGTTRWIYANNSQLTWKLNTNNDPTPTAVTSPNSDQVDCSYTVTISSNLADCSYAIAGISPTTSNTFTLTRIRLSQLLHRSRRIPKPCRRQHDHGHAVCLHGPGSEPGQQAGFGEKSGVERALQTQI